jgi:hypothetical protein
VVLTTSPQILFTYPSNSAIPSALLHISFHIS